MASGAKMSYNHFQSGKFGGMPQMSGKDAEITQDMHLKMSKKIAQLTKVIYALNTKNDEHESVLQALREQHEEEIQQILSDTRQKVAVFKDKLDAQNDGQATITALQERIAEHQVQQSSIEEQFSQYKANITDKLEQERSEHAKKLQEMSHNVMLAKQEFENQILQFSSWKEKVTEEHNSKLSDMQSQHLSEMEDLRSFQRNQDDTWLNQCAKIEEKFKSQIEELKSQIEAFEKVKADLNEEYTGKLEKSKAFYEKELEALKNSQNEQSSEEISKLRKELDKMRGDNIANEKELRAQIERLVRQLADTEDLLEESKKQQDLLQAELAGKDSNSSELAIKIKDMTEQLASQASRLHTAQTELTAAQQHSKSLAEELGKKSTVVGQLEAQAMQHQSKMAALQAEMDKLKAQLRSLEAEKAGLQSQQKSLSSEQQTQLDSLRTALEDLSVEKETLTQRYEKQIRCLQDDLVNSEKTLREEAVKKLSEMEKTHAAARENDRKAAAEVLTQTKQELRLTHEAELSAARAHASNLQSELESLRAELEAKLKAAEEELSRLQGTVAESQAGLGSASGQLQAMREQAEAIRAELEKTTRDLKQVKTQLALAQAELEKTKLRHEGEVKELDHSHRKQLQQQQAEIDAKWKDTIKAESAKLRQELSQQLEAEKRAALTQLAKLKDQEIEAVRLGMEGQVEALKNQIAALESAVAAKAEDGKALQAEWERRLERQQSDLNHKMLEAAADYATKVERMEQMHKEELARLQEKMNLEKEEAERALAGKHIEQMEGQLAAHRAALDHSRQQSEREKEQQKREAIEKQKQEMEALRAELAAQAEGELATLRGQQQAELMAARMELDRAVEIGRQKDAAHNAALEELKTELGHRQQHVANLQEQLIRMQEEIAHQKKEVEAGQARVTQAQRQAQQQLRIQEDKLKRQHVQQLEDQAAEHLREQQEILAQLTQAQEMLKDKISELQIELQEAQLRYEQRDSRPEDLELIESLRCEVNERETRIKDLIEEKRFYQLELVNRETNFNKVFNTAPNVGVLNPFAQKKKKGEKGPSLTMNGNSGSHQRLDPLPNSPLHDGKLNPTKPLPQPAFTKKFMK